MTESRPPAPPTLAWQGGADGRLVLLDQTRLPDEVREYVADDVPSLVQAIQALVVRGAPALGVAAAYGCVLAARGADPRAALEAGITALRASRPTAVNLPSALDRMAAIAAATADAELGERLLAEAKTVHEEDAALCRAMAEHGAALIEDGMTVLTHCNTGRLATGGIGTAFGVIRTAFEQGKRIKVLADETRPLLQGARLTMFELDEAGIPAALLVDGAGPGLMARGQIDAVFVGADRIAANGDAANKVGTYPLALAAKAAEVPFYIVAPTTTLDLTIHGGDEIVIEERSPEEVWGPGSTRPARNPAFDVTPHGLITALVTERGVLTAPDRDGIKGMMA